MPKFIKLTRIGLNNPEGDVYINCNNITKIFAYSGKTHIDMIGEDWADVTESVETVMKMIVEEEI